jgi:hypothetical protein
MTEDTHERFIYETRNSMIESDWVTIEFFLEFLLMPEEQLAWSQSICTRKRYVYV